MGYILVRQTAAMFFRGQDCRHLKLLRLAQPVSLNMPVQAVNVNVGLARTFVLRSRLHFPLKVLTLL